jgi:signal peptidase
MTTVGLPIPAGVLPNERVEDTPRDAVPAAGHGIGGVVRHAANLGAAALASVLLLFIGASGICALTNHHVEQVITGSMVPAVPVGSVVLTEQVGVGSLHVGDILVFPKPTNRSEVIVHRIVAIATGRDGSIQLHTKGDANRAEDPWVIKQGAQGLAARAISVLPSLGSAAAVARTALIVLLAGLLIAGVMTWSRRQYLAIVGNDG